MYPCLKSNSHKEPDVLANVEKWISWHDRFYIEKKKLEAMVRKFFKDGNENLGENEEILQQSSVLDKLIAERMSLQTEDIV